MTIFLAAADLLRSYFADFGFILRLYCARSTTVQHTPVGLCRRTLNSFALSFSFSFRRCICLVSSTSRQNLFFLLSFLRRRQFFFVIVVNFFSFSSPSSAFLRMGHSYNPLLQFVLRRGVPLLLSCCSCVGLLGLLLLFVFSIGIKHPIDVSCSLSSGSTCSCLLLLRRPPWPLVASRFLVALALLTRNHTSA